MKVQKGNVIRKISDSRLAEFEALGYQRLDANGKPIKPKEKETTAKIVELEAVISEKQKTIEALEAKIVELEAVIKGK